jgi:hypothetical protein
VLILGAFFLNQMRFSELKFGDGHWTKLRNHGFLVMVIIVLSRKRFQFFIFYIII